MANVSTHKVYNGIDLFKLIAAVLVVLLHSIETNEWYSCEIKFVFTRFAVPFFFIASGFFFYKGLDNAEDKQRYFIRYEKNLLKIFIVWGVVIYSPVTITTYIQKYSGAGIISLILYILRRVIVIGPGPYWYLIALMWSVVFLYFCYIKRADWLIYSGIVIGLLLEILYACFQGIFEKFALFRCFFKMTYIIYSWEFNFIMYGIPFMGIGYLISKKNYMIDIKVSSIVWILSTIARIFEYNAPKIFPSNFWESNNISFAFIFQAIAFFMMAQSLKLPIKERLSLAIRQISSCIYFSHAIFLYNILNPVLKEFTNIAIYDAKYIFPKVVIVIMLCMLLFFVVKKINNKYLNVLING